MEDATGGLTAGQGAWIEAMGISQDLPQREQEEEESEISRQLRRPGVSRAATPPEEAFHCPPVPTPSHPKVQGTAVQTKSWMNVVVDYKLIEGNESKRVTEDLQEGPLHLDWTIVASGPIVPKWIGASSSRSCGIGRRCGRSQAPAMETQANITTSERSQPSLPSPARRIAGPSMPQEMEDIAINCCQDLTMEDLNRKSTTAEILMKELQAAKQRMESTSMPEAHGGV